MPSAAQAESPNIAAPQAELEPREAIASTPPAKQDEAAVEVPSLPAQTPQQAPAAKPVGPVAKATAKFVVAPALAEEPRKLEASIAVAKTPEPTLDLAGLTARLRDTKAIGVLTKLALSNQVDDLLKLFRKYHLGAQKTGVDSLRPPYDMLFLKVLAVVQDGDPSLARSISRSREAIWAILADREKFKSIT